MVMVVVVVVVRGGGGGGGGGEVGLERVRAQRRFMRGGRG
jgi:hypothetical protein